MWIKLHLRKSNKLIFIRTEHISCVSEFYSGGTVIGFIGNESNYIDVAEDIDEVSKMIGIDTR